jgi:uncharacterized cupin superfamily protein
MPNVFEPEWDVERDDGPFRWRRAFVARQAGSRRLGASVYELAPGGATFPLHAHYINEELIVVLAGEPTLTAGDGVRRRLAPGDVVACPAGPAGAHRLDNETADPARVMVVSTMHSPETNLMLEDGTYWLHDWTGTEPGLEGLDVRLRPVD